MHVGLIPDGHRRYARKNNISNREAYLKSQDLIFEISKKFNDGKQEYLSKKKLYEEEIDEITVYALSEKNLKRDEEELEIFYSAIEKYFDMLIQGKKIDFDETDKIDIEFISTKYSILPGSIKTKAEKIEDKFCGDGIKLNILLSYDGRKEIAQTVSDINNPNTEEVWDNLLLNSEIDFVIRTGDNPYRECLSGFPIWQSSYSEFYHLDKNFPAVEKEDINESLEHYQKLRRKKGR